jgi:hypothetical protein
MASIGEANLQRLRVPLLPGMLGPVNGRRMEEMKILVETFRDALVDQQDQSWISSVKHLSSSAPLVCDPMPNRYWPNYNRLLKWSP